MLDRRETVFGGLFTIIWSSGTCCHASGDDDDVGCVLDDHEATIAFTRSTPAQTIQSEGEKLIASSGDKDLDFALARTLARLSSTFGVLPGFAFLDGPRSNNAWATTKTLLHRADGTVLFGRRHLEKKLRAPEAPDAVVAATCAHEYGHILQFKKSLKTTVFARENNSKRFELHADFLAGYFAGVSKLRDPNFPAAVFATSRHSAGDRNFQSKTHHGTPEERASATVKGFEVAYREKKPIGEALQTGIRYVLALK